MNRIDVLKEISKEFGLKKDVEYSLQIKPNVKSEYTKMIIITPFTKYNGRWNKHADVIKDFDDEDCDVLDSEVIYAIYDGGSYDGQAHVLYQRDGKLYYVNESHCSCNGLDKTWYPVETSKATLRKEYSRDDGSEWSQFLKEFLR